MGRYSCITFHAPNREYAQLEAALRDALSDHPKYGEREPYTWEYEGNLVWKVREKFDPQLDIEVPKVLEIYYCDTACIGTGTLYERIDGRFVRTDYFNETTSSLGRQVIDYFRVNHGIEATIHD
ncbi:hypothetical protein [Haloferax sp. DFSO60]|uniref:hypothetical protein n=1 Tax=Haloferax sp. DFSO60 TaxID=3388652 RepID=UPI0039782B48